MAKRMSTFSISTLAPRPSNQPSGHISTTILLDALHTSYVSRRPYALDAATSLVVNASIHSGEPRPEPVVDHELIRRAWEHARRRAEDGCIVLGSLHHSTPSVLIPVIDALPVDTPISLFTALSTLKAFTCHVTPFNPSFARHSSLAVNFTLNLLGNIRGVSIALSKSGIDTKVALLQLPEEKGYRAFDVFYYLLNAASTPAERDFLKLKHPSVYAFLNRSGSYDPPSYLPTADDAASAEDFRIALRELGIKGAAHRNMMAILAGLLKLGDTLGLLIDEEDLDEVCEDVAGLLGLEPEVVSRQCSTNDRMILVAGLYECLVDWLIGRANHILEREVQSARGESASRLSALSGLETSDSGDDDGEDVVSITLVDIPTEGLAKAVSLRGVFDDSLGINSEMKDDGVELEPASAAALREMHNAVSDFAVDLDVASGSAAQERHREFDQRNAVLERVGHESEDGGFLREVLFPVSGQGVLIGKHGRFDLADTVLSSRVWYHLSLHPTDESPEELAGTSYENMPWSATVVSHQLRRWRLAEWASRRNRNADYTADFDIEEFASRYARLGCLDGRDGVESWIMERGWSNGDAVVGRERVWIRESAWWEAEEMIDMKPAPGQQTNPFVHESPYGFHANDSAFFPPNDDEIPFGSRDNLLPPHQGFAGALGGAKSIAPTAAKTLNTMTGDYGLGARGDDRYNYDREYDGPLDPELGDPKHITTEGITFGRRAWVAFVWGVTFWIPSFVLRYVGQMKRPDVRMAWREKIVLVLLIFLLNAAVVFYIVEFGNLLCPNFDKAWNSLEVSEHQGEDDFYVSIHGKVYDITNFWQLPHSKVQGALTNDQTMLPFAGQNLDVLFPPPLYMACPQLVKDKTIQLRSNATVYNGAAVHLSGANAQFPQSDLRSDNWYTNTFMPKIKDYYKGDLVWDPGNVTADGRENHHMWIILHNNIYDFTDYFNTQQLENPENNVASLAFLPSDVIDLVQNNPGQDLSSQWGKSANFTNALDCMNNVFYKGITDFREGPRCQVNNYILLAFTIILCLVILVKFVSALQFGSKRRPAPQDKFVICQVPAYTEGEDQLRKGLDSLTALQYDNKRKLICVICDGMIVGSGNDRPTPKIVLDILGVDPKIDPPALPFKSVGHGSDQLNYAKVYSGLYESEGNVVPYIVIVKVGKDSEQTKTKPGNRGKRDSQIMLLNFLNRVHHRAPMNPLELEIFHQINNVIGVDPELYEYIFMVDADTSVREDSLNRLVASCAHDARIAGICGETSLQNEDRSWWTMIQVYEYYISHHLAKAFESLFGSVTCLPGCFCMYRLRTADKGRPLIISDKIVSEYSDGNVDTLHKKNLFSLGEDRYLTTLMTKHFPQMSYKFVPDAYAATAAPESWSVLLSPRRRWINSTVHNLVELMSLKDLCGFCCFSMRFVVFIDLFGTLILPATCCYLGYLIYRVATHSGQFPLISIVMIAAVYGLQAMIFLLRRQWQHIGWMIIYIIAFPFYSFVLPIYSFWKQDDFSWGTTRIVIGEKGDRQVVALDDGGFDPRSIPLQRWDDYAAQQNLPGLRGGAEKGYDPGAYPDGYEMDDLRTVYSDARPASTAITGFGGLHTGGGGLSGAYLPPQSPAYALNMSQVPRHSTAPSFSAGFPSAGLPPSAGLYHPSPQYHDAPQYPQSRHMRVSSTPVLEPYRDAPSPGPAAVRGTAHRSSSSQQLQLAQRSMSSQLDLRGAVGGARTPPARLSRSPLAGTTPPRGARSPLGMVDGRAGGPSDADISGAVQACLGEVDLERVTKKQVRAMVEQRLGVQISGERKEFLDQSIDGELSRM